MKKIFYFAAIVLAGGMAMTSCSKDDNSEDKEVIVIDATPIVTTFTENVVEPTYADMKVGNLALKTAVDKFADNPTQENMNNCADAWLAARAPWERSEAYLFGPVEDFNVDPNIDSWPLEEGSIKQIMAASNWAALNGSSQISQEVKGYHTLEYLIFKDGVVRDIAKDADYLANPNGWKTYMQKVAEQLVSETDGLYNYWFTAGSELYGGTFKAYFCGGDYENPLGELIEGCSGIAEEVGASKIGGPVEMYDEDQEAAVLQVESWYSWHSREDYMNNIRGIRYTYIGKRSDSYDEYDKNSLRAVVLEYLGSDEDTQVRNAIDEAINAIDAIQQPFRDHINSTEAKTAMTKCAELKNVLDDLQAQLGLN